MVRARAGAVIAMALFLLVPVMAGCVGSSSSSPSDGSSETGESTSTAPSGEAPPEEPGNTSQADDNATETAETENATTVRDPVTFTNSTKLNASLGVFWYDWGEPYCNPDNTVPCGLRAAGWTLLGNRPEDVVAVRVEASWDTATEGTEIGKGKLGVTTENDGYTNTTSGTSSPIGLWVLPTNWRKDMSIDAQVTTVGPAGVWVDADVTVTTTIFWEEPPSWEFSAAE